MFVLESSVFNIYLRMFNRCFVPTTQGSLTLGLRQ